MGALGAGEGDRSGAQLRGELPLDLPGAVAEAGGEPGDALAVDDAVGDEAHGAAHDVGPYVPLGGAGHGVGRQRRQAWKPAPCAAAAAVVKKRTWARLGVTAGQLGRQ